MPKNYRNKLGAELKSEAVDLFICKIKSISSASDLENFFDGFITKREKETLLRIFAAYILSSRGTKYRDIKEQLEISGSTVSMANRLMGGKISRHKPKAGARAMVRNENKKNKIRFPRYKGTKGLGWFE